MELIKTDPPRLFKVGFNRKITIADTGKIKLESSGLVSNWMWYFQRNDVNMRNEWSNYTNWPYKEMPYPYTNVDGMYLKVSGQHHPENQLP